MKIERRNGGRRLKYWIDPYCVRTVWAVGANSMRYSGLTAGYLFKSA